MPSEGATSPALRRVRAAAAGPHARAYSSAGERLVDIEEVPGSIPGTPTITFNGLSVLFNVPEVRIRVQFGCMPESQHLTIQLGIEPLHSFTKQSCCGSDGTAARSEERRVGKEWVSTCRSRWSR